MQRSRRSKLLHARGKRLLAAASPALVGWLGAGLLRPWMATVRMRTNIDLRYHPLHNPDAPSSIFAIWHDTLLIPAYAYRRLHQYTLISRSGDGEYIARVARRLGWQVIRGSSSRGATTALRRMLALAQERRVHLAIPADGPRGPRHLLKAGLVYTASRTGAPVVPVGIAVDRAWRANSWDRFVIPYPFSTASVVTEPHIAVPPDADAETLERYRRRIEASMHRATCRAQRLLGQTDRAAPAPPIADAA